MLKIFICDDEEIHRNRITNIIKNYVMMMDYDVEFQLAADNPYDILSYVSTNKTEGIYFFRYRFKFRYQWCGTRKADSTV